MRRTRIFTIAIKTLLIVLSASYISCATSSLENPPRLKDRTLHISADSPKLLYPYYKEICEHPDRWFFKNCKTIHVIEEYDLTDSNVRKTLIDQGFVARSVNRFDN